MGSSFVVDPGLINAIKAEKCAVFVGAGMSRRSGFPSWQGLLGQLVDIAIREGLLPKTGKKLTEIRKHVKQPSDSLLVAQELSNIFGQELFRDHLVTIFNSSNAPSIAHMLLTDIPANLIVTTNYDRLLENAYAKKSGAIPALYNYTQAADFGSALWRDEFFILKAHGDVTTRASMVITERDYRTLIHAAPGYKATMSAIFTMSTVLFLGVSLNDPDVRLLLSYLYDAFHGSGPRHYAFVPRNQFTQTEVSHWLREYKIQCITYMPANDTHPEIDEFLTEVKSLI